MCLALSWAPFLPYFLAHSVSPVSFPHRSGQPMAPSHPASLAYEGPQDPHLLPGLGVDPCREAIHIWPQGTGLQDRLQPWCIQLLPEAHIVHHRHVLDPGLLGHVSHRTLKDKQADGDGVGSSFGGVVGAGLWQW